MQVRIRSFFLPIRNSVSSSLSINAITQVYNKTASNFVWLLTGCEISDQEPPQRHFMSGQSVFTDPKPTAAHKSAACVMTSHWPLLSCHNIPNPRKIKDITRSFSLSKILICKYKISLQLTLVYVSSLIKYYCVLTGIKIKLCIPKTIQVIYCNKIFNSMVKQWPNMSRVSCCRTEELNARFLNCK